MLLCRSAPYQGLRARAALDAGLATAVFDQSVSLLFMDDAVWQLLPGQDPSGIDRKSLEATLDSLPLYDVDKLYADETSLRQRGVKPAQLRPGITLLTDAELPAFIEGFEQVWSF